MHTFRITDELVEVRSGLISARTARRGSIGSRASRSRGRCSPASSARPSSTSASRGTTRTCSSPTCRARPTSCAARSCGWRPGPGQAGGRRRTRRRAGLGREAASPRSPRPSSDPRSRARTALGVRPTIRMPRRLIGCDPAAAPHRSSCSPFTVWLAAASSRWASGSRGDSGRLPGFCPAHRRRLLHRTGSAVAALLDRGDARRRAGGLRPALDQQRDPSARPHPRDRDQPAAALAAVRTGGRCRINTAARAQSRRARTASEHHDLPVGTPSDVRVLGLLLPGLRRRGRDLVAAGCSRRTGPTASRRAPRGRPGCAALLAAHRLPPAPGRRARCARLRLARRSRSCRSRACRASLSPGAAAADARSGLRAPAHRRRARSTPPRRRDRRCRRPEPLRATRQSSASPARDSTRSHRWRAGEASA